MTRPPDRSEAPEYYFTYIDKVPAGDIIQILETQSDEAFMLLRGISDERSLHRYAAGKWSVREVLGHLNDTERLFVFRALWFARGFDTPLPGFDQNTAVAAAASNERSWRALIEEFRAVRAGSIAFFQNLPPEAWDRRGIASGNPFSVRALAYMVAGHLVHHTDILRARYL